MRVSMRTLIGMVMLVQAAATFNLSNTLGDGMVLQRGSAVVWGFGQPGATITTEIVSKPAVSTVVGADSIWRQVLSTGAANKAPTNILFSDGTTNLTLAGVMIGDVFICSG